jgi:phosphatidylglycerophosphatase A
MAYIMQIYEETENLISINEETEFLTEAAPEMSFSDTLGVAIGTCGVGFIKYAPGTWGSAVGVGIYLILRWFEANLLSSWSAKSWQTATIEFWRTEMTLAFVLVLSAISIWAGNKMVKVFKNKDPQQAVIDEVVGQVIGLAFLPLFAPWYLILLGFFIFRFFDILKPYPINSLQNLPGGLGVVADDILAGIYTAILLSFWVALFSSIGL